MGYRMTEFGITDLLSRRGAAEMSDVPASPCRRVPASVHFRVFASPRPASFACPLITSNAV